MAQGALLSPLSETIIIAGGADVQQAAIAKAELLVFPSEILRGIVT
jgi:hypothetical protein